MQEPDRIEILDAEIVEVVEEHGAEEWAHIIRADLGQVVASSIKAGPNLLNAKQQVEHGEFESVVCKGAGISPQTARMLMQIARHSALTNRQHVSDLPSSWATLYELSRLEAPWLQAAIEAGRVHPDPAARQLLGGAGSPVAVYYRCTTSVPPEAPIRAIRPVINPVRVRSSRR